MAAQTAKQFYFLIGLLFTITLRAPRYCFPFSSLIVCAPESAALQQAKLFPAAFHNTTQHSPHKGPVVPGTHTHPIPNNALQSSIAAPRWSAPPRSLPHVRVFWSCKQKPKVALICPALRLLWHSTTLCLKSAFFLFH